MPVRGVSIEQDSRFKNKEEVLLKSTRFPSVFNERVDMSKVSVPVMRPWIETRVEQMMGFEDDVLVEFIVGLLEGEQFPDPRKMQIALTGFLEKRAAPFMNELWQHLVSAQTSVGGVPRAFVEQKKREMQAMRGDNAAAMDHVRRQAPASYEARGHSTEERRWDRGRPPISAADRRPRRSPDEFVDKNGNRTRRERDAGWGARAQRGPYPEDRGRSYRDEFGRERIRHSYHDTSRERSPSRSYEAHTPPSARRGDDSPRYSPPPARERSRSP